MGARFADVTADVSRIGASIFANGKLRDRGNVKSREAPLPNPRGAQTLPADSQHLAARLKHLYRLSYTDMRDCRVVFTHRKRFTEASGLPFVWQSGTNVNGSCVILNIHTKGAYET